MARRKADTNKPFQGTFDVKIFDKALSEIESEHQVPREETYEILRQAIDKAVRDTLNPRKIEGLADMNTETVIDEDSGEIICSNCLEVVNEDDITDDLVQVSVEDAQEEDPSLNIGDTLKRKIDLSKLDYQFFRKAIQNFQQKISAASKTALLSQYNDRVGEIISGVVEKIDGNYVTVAINKVTTTLTPQNTIPGEKFSIGDTIKVFLNGVGSEDGKEKSTQLMITRTNDRFLAKLFEFEIPDIADKTVKIKAIAREAGLRSKVAVYSDSQDVDPTGACIGNDGKRIKDICSQLSNEKIDVIKYIDNPYLYIAEALKPANVVGVVINDETHRAIAVVRNGESKIAIGKRGVNVRLASRLVGYSIDIKEQDVAMSEHISYSNIDDIKRKNALELLDAAENETNDSEDENDIVVEYSPIEEKINEEVVAAPEIKEETVQEEVPTFEKAEDEVVEEEVKPVETEQVKSINDVEHVEITTKAKVSLAELEKQIEEEKKRQSAQPSSSSYYKKKYNKDEKEEKKEDKKVVIPSNAMPIYTEEELQEIEAQEKEDSVSEEDYEDYDDDQYYEGK